MNEAHIARSQNPQKGNAHSEWVPLLTSCEFFLIFLTLRILSL
jgi:hypothetical protein